MNKALPGFSQQLYKVTLAFIVSAVIWLAYFFIPNNFFVDPLNILFIALVFVYLLLVGFLFNSFLIMLLIGGFIFWVTLIFLLVSHYDDFTFWQMTFAQSTAETLGFQIGIGVALSSAVFLIFSFFKLKLSYIDNQFKRTTHNTPLLILSISLLTLTLASPFLIGYKYSVTPLDIFSAIQDRRDNTKIEKILQISPEQALEFYLSSLEAGDYENAYYAQTSDTSFDEISYYNFIDEAKEEDIQLSKPIKHTVEKDPSSIDGSNEVSYNVAIIRGDGSNQEYKISLSNNMNKWYIKERKLVAIN